LQYAPLSDPSRAKEFTRDIACLPLDSRIEAASALKAPDGGDSEDD
jgi:hypothetical protein